MKIPALLFSILLGYSCLAQEISAAEFQENLNNSFLNEEESPLDSLARKEFTSLPFFDINEELIFDAHFIRIEDSEPFQMKTSTERLPEYRKFGEIQFELDGKNFVLSVYQNLALLEQGEHEDYLFLPFNDASNGEDSYGGGRFIDLRIPDGDQIILDFNKAYNPLCAYNHAYSCPIPPEENRLEIRIEAGVKYKASLDEK